MLAQLPIVPKKTGEVLQAGTRDDAMIALLKGQCGKGRGFLDVVCYKLNPMHWLTCACRPFTVCSTTSNTDDYNRIKTAGEIAQCTISLPCRHE